MNLDNIILRQRSWERYWSHKPHIIWFYLYELSDYETPCTVAHQAPLSISSVQFSSVTQSCPTLCEPMNRSTPGLPVHHQLPEFIQTHVHRVSDAIQPSYPLSSPSPPVPNPSQHQGLFQWTTLPMRWPEYWSFSFSIIPSKEIPVLCIKKTLKMKLL